MDNKKVPKNPNNYLCDKCNYVTQYKRDYEKHLLTAKHKKITNDNEISPFEIKNFSCICGKVYKNRHNLCRHRNNCRLETIRNEDKSTILDTNIILGLINQNQEFKDVIIQQSKQLVEQANQYSKDKDDLINKLIEREPGGSTFNTNSNNNNTINNNQKFNLNFFLNETCKDAMSIREFIENIRITFEDLITIGNTGFVNGVSDILIKQLNDLDVNKRPIHCTDAKRETIYLKEDAAWNKDDKEKTKLKQMIEKIEYKNVAALRDWCNENPDAKVNNTPNNLLKDKIFYQTLQGDEKTRDKIIKNISREVVVEKDN